MLQGTRWIVLPLLFVWFCLLAGLWLLELLPWKLPSRLSAQLERWGSLDIDELGGFSNARLILVSAVGLFLELLLIRWLSSEIRIFAYFKNVVLVGCFFGFGLGCYLSRKRIRLMQVLVPLVSLTLITQLPWTALNNLIVSLSAYIGGLADVHVWDRHVERSMKLYAGAGLAFSVLIPALAMATICMIPMGQMVARYLETARAGIRAYSANVAASVLGIWLFTGLCFLSAPPIVWFGVLGVLMLVLFWSVSRLRAPILLCFLVLLLLFAGPQISDFQIDRYFAANTAYRGLYVEWEKMYWSPYQKLALSSLAEGKERIELVLTTNGSWYQNIMNLSPEFADRYPQYTEQTKSVPLAYHRYNFPYRFVNHPGSVLILGAGMGNDVAAALRNGAQRVVAVEIDPMIQRLGRDYHLEHPYTDPRVEVVVDDARSYVQNCKEQFDLIVSSILDSHITQSTFTNIRTDNYVYTREGLTYMKRLVKPGGMLSLSFSYERPWFNGRLAALMQEVYGHPVLNVHNAYSFFFAGDNVNNRLAEDAELRAFVLPRMNPPSESASPTSDDWPYFYQRRRGVPVIVVALSVVLIGICAMVLRGTGLSTTNLQWHFFFLGAGFMLMEVQIISRLALLFGTTWVVNSIAISALLLLILFSNAVVGRLPAAGNSLAYVGLFVTLASCYFVPLESLLFESWWLRAFASTLFVCLPVFFAGLIFISSFAQCRFQAEAFGSNLFGSVVGGLLEALSFWTGLRSLLIVAGLCYLLSLVARRGLSASRVPAAAPSVSD